MTMTGNPAMSFSSSTELYSASWIASIVLHAMLTVGAFIFAQQITLAPQRTPFIWDVAMVPASAKMQPAAASFESADADTKPSAPSPLPHKSSPSLTPTSKPQAIAPAAHPVSPVSSSLTSPPPAVKQDRLNVHPDVSNPSTTARPVPNEPITREKDDVQPVERSLQPTPVESTPPASSSHRPTESESLPKILESTSLPEPAPEVPHQSAVIEPPESAPTKEFEMPESAPPSPLVAMAPVPSPPVARPDYGWLSETILRRVEELKRYPPEARLDRAEGRVVLKAVIRGDGSVGDVVVQESSGHLSLDHAAVELLKSAAPFQLPRPLGKSQLTVKIPMNYRLEQ